MKNKDEYILELIELVKNRKGYNIKSDLQLYLKLKKYPILDIKNLYSNFKLNKEEYEI